MSTFKKDKPPLTKWLIYLYQYTIYIFKLLLWKVSQTKIFKSYKQLKPVFRYSLPVLLFLIIIIPLALTTNVLNVPDKPLTLKTTPSKSTFYYTAKNQTLTANIGAKDTNKPSVEVTSPKGGKVSFAYAADVQNLPKPQKQGNSLTFQNIDVDTDVKYTTLPNGIKEEIILKSAPPQNEFNFEIYLTDATPKKLTGNIYLPVFYNNEGEYIFHFDKPFAIDAAGEKTYDLQLQIVKDPETGQYSGKIISNPLWLHDPKRVYPVVIDPTIIYESGDYLFSYGSYNRVTDTGSVSNPNIELSYKEVPVDEYTVGLWRLNETSGASAFDSGPNNLTLSYINTPTQVAGIISNSLQFNGTDNYAIANSPATTNIVNWTIEAWIKPTSLNQIGMAVYNGIDNPTSSGGYGFGVGNGSGNAGAKLQGLIGGIVWIDSGYTFTDTDWHHVAMVRDTSTTYFYVDGELTSGSSTATPNTPIQNFTIGYGVSGSSRYFEGYVDEVRISETARSAEEIKINATRYPYGVYLSNIIDANLIGVSGYNPLSWTQNLPTDTNLNIQLRSGVWGNLTNIFDGYDNYSMIGSSTSATIYGGKITTCVAPTGLYLDVDGDGYGAANTGNPGNVCKTPDYTYVANNTDCDDSNGSISRTVSGYLDADGDSYGYGSLVTCAPQTGSYVANNTDCDDTNASILTVTASGGTITSSGADFTHTFTSSGTFALTCPASLATSVLVVGGGGGAGYENTSTTRGGGAGGGGGLIYIPSYSLSSGTYTVTIGAGGSGGTSTTDTGKNGGNSIFGSLTALGGGGGGSRDTGYRDGLAGGSGGGGGRYDGNAGAGGAGLQPSQPGDSGTYGYGNAGAANNGGGGGAGGAASGGTKGPGMTVFGLTELSVGGKWDGSGSAGGTNQGQGGDTKGDTVGETGGAGGSGIVVVKYTLP